MPKITPREFESIAKDRVPIVNYLGCSIEEIGEGTAKGRAVYREEFLRPGGTVAGPVLMALADFVMYAAVLSKIGRVELAVTTNLSINFLRRPSPNDVVAYASLIKLGKRLAVGEVDLYSDGEEELIAHVTCTYSIPPD
ncbi:MAG: PaaI family thioesterase [Arenicellales bacterium]|nr:PaaI family thioesterase [Arenicellales bacterium]